jgi:hypothetical protein
MPSSIAERGGRWRTNLTQRVSASCVDPSFPCVFHMNAEENSRLAQPYAVRCQFVGMGTRLAVHLAGREERSCTVCRSAERASHALSV